MRDKTLAHGYEHMLAIWQEGWQNCHTPRHYRALWGELLTALPSYRDAYWEYHYLFETAPQAKPIALLGTTVKNEMLFNAALPLLYHHCTEHAGLEEKNAFLALYRTAPANGHGKADFLRQRFFGETAAATPLFHKATIEQGALQLHSDFCRHFETSCLGCPFVERFLSTPTHCNRSRGGNV
jgi:hypothetical protein